MSYSFSIRATSKAEANDRVSEELAKVVANQPVHEADQAQAQAAAQAFIAILPDDDAKDVAVSVNGSVAWNGTYPTDAVPYSVSVGVNASLIAKEPTA